MGKQQDLELLDSDPAIDTDIEYSDVDSFEIDSFSSDRDNRDSHSRKKRLVQKKIEMQLEKRRLKRETESLYDDWD